MPFRVPTSKWMSIPTFSGYPCQHAFPFTSVAVVLATAGVKWDHTGVLICIFLRLSVEELLTRLAFDKPSRQREWRENVNPEAAPSSDGQVKEGPEWAVRRAAEPTALRLSSCSRQELDALQQVWEITRDWEESWNQWKTGCFLTLQTEAMESMAHGLYRRLTRLAKEYKVHGTGWETRWPCPS